MGPYRRTFVSRSRTVLHGIDAEQLVTRRDRHGNAIFLELDERPGDVAAAAIRISIADPATFAADARGLRRLAELAAAIAAELELADQHGWNVPLEFPPSGALRGGGAVTMPDEQDPATAVWTAAAAADYERERRPEC